MIGTSEPRAIVLLFYGESAMTLILSKSIELFPMPVFGKVEQPITSTQSGRVQAMASFWPAQFYDPNCQAILVPGHSVTIVGRQGIHLLVVPSGDRLPTISRSRHPLARLRSLLFG